MITSHKLETNPYKLEPLKANSEPDHYHDSISTNYMTHCDEQQQAITTISSQTI